MCVAISLNLFIICTKDLFAKGSKLVAVPNWAWHTTTHMRTAVCILRMKFYLRPFTHRQRNSGSDAGVNGLMVGIVKLLDLYVCGNIVRDDIVTLSCLFIPSFISIAMIAQTRQHFVLRVMLYVDKTAYRACHTKALCSHVVPTFNRGTWLLPSFLDGS